MVTIEPFLPPVTKIQKVMTTAGNEVKKKRPRIRIKIENTINPENVNVKVEVPREQYNSRSELPAELSEQLRKNAASRTYTNPNQRLATSNADEVKSAAAVKKQRKPKNGLGIKKTDDEVLVSKIGSDKNYTLYMSEPDGGTIQAKFKNGRLHKYEAKSANGLETTCVNKSDGNWEQYTEKDSSGNKTVWSWKDGHVEKILTKSNGETVVLKDASDGKSHIENLPNGGKRYVEDYSKGRRIECEYDSQGNWTSYTEMSDGIKMTWRFDDIGRIVAEFTGKNYF